MGQILYCPAVHFFTIAVMSSTLLNSSLVEFVSIINVWQVVEKVLHLGVILLYKLTP